MVLESLMNPMKARNHPAEMILIGMLYSTIGIFISILVFREDSSLVMIFLAVLASAQFMYGAVKQEETYEMNVDDRKVLFKEHGKTLLYFMYLFMGFVIAYSAWFAILPDNVVEDVYRVQIRDINFIQGTNYVLTGDAINYENALSEIFLNNMIVLVFCLLFSFFYGVGAIFVLTWNASVIGTAIGIFLRTGFAELGTNYFAFIPVTVVGVMRYMIHGTPEILAYFMAGLAGGIVSIAIIKHDYGSPRFKKVLKDSFDLMILSIFILFISALIEVFITPALF